jgi:hypothetical protein
MSAQKTKLKGKLKSLFKSAFRGAFFIIFFLYFVSFVLAGDINYSFSFPEEVEQLEEFEVGFNVSGLKSEAVYYFKVRIGKDSSLTKAENWNGENWLYDTSSWSKFPSIITNKAGELAGLAKVRVKDDVETGINDLVLRLHNDSTNYNSQVSKINILKAVISPSPKQSSSPLPSSSCGNFYPNNIFLSEFMPNPSGGEEWVELYNNNSFEVDLTDWQVDDIEGGSSPETLASFVISAKSFKVLYLGSSKLNNSGDEVRLIRPDGWVLDKTSYTSSAKGISWSLQENLWCETEPSMGKENNNCLEAEKDEDEEKEKEESSSPLPSEGEVLGEDVMEKAYKASFNYESRESTSSSASGVKIASISGEVLGDEKLDEENVGNEGENTSTPLFFWLILTGGLIMAGSAVPLVLPKLKKLKNSLIEQRKTNIDF